MKDLSDSFWGWDRMPKLVGFGLVKSDSFVDVFKEYPVQFFVVSDHCAVVANCY